MKRRAVLISAFVAIVAQTRLSQAVQLPVFEVYRNPGCSCCEAWVNIMRKAGFTLSVQDDPDLDIRRASLKVPEQMGSCHIAIASGFSFIGHVPPADVAKFLAAPPAGAIGLAVPGMPVGSPGMGPEGSGPSYDVMLLTLDSEPKVFSAH